MDNNESDCISDRNSALNIELKNQNFTKTYLGQMRIQSKMRESPDQLSNVTLP